MRHYYLKNGKLYLHLRQEMISEFQDNSDISGMLYQSYVTYETKEGAIQFLEKREADRFMATKGRKLKGFEIIYE